MDLSKDTLAFARERRRMCVAMDGCENCELNYDYCLLCAGDEANDILILNEVQKWHDEHPKKTYLMDFLEKHPNCRRGDNGIPDSCRDNIYGTNIDCRCTSCEKCWHEPMED